MFHPSPAEFAKLARQADRVPVFARLVADQLTPVSAYARLARGASHAFLFESVVGSEKVARYSFVGAHPNRILQAFGPSVRLLDRGRRRAASFDATDPLGALETLVRGVRVATPSPQPGALERLPRFTGGAVGYAAYDVIRYSERLPDAPPDDRGLPELEFGLYETMLVFDHVNRTVLVVSHADAAGEGRAKAYAAACRRISAVVRTLQRPAPADAPLLAAGPPPLPTFESNLTRPRFERAVRDSIEYIRAGDIFQVVLSQRLRTRTAAAPFDIYRALRVVNPSPFMFMLHGPSCTLVGASPEILCRVEDGVVTSRPLAGTRRRGRTPTEDAALERELLADPKDRAEHIMLVDLGRNDVGRVAAPGSVKLGELMSIERYSHVMHISSNVSGRLAPGRTAIDALRAALPVGTVSGAPKVRAMQIIDQFEPTRRGPYAGAVGYLDFSGNMDTCIALRTMVITQAGRLESDVSRKRGARARGRAAARGGFVVDIQAGAGIVADSRPAAEYAETMNKARALLTAVAVAERAFPRR